MPQIQVKLREPKFEDAKWSVAEANPGAAVTLQVTAEDLDAEQEIFFEIRDPDGLVAVEKATAEGAEYKVKDWGVPNTFAARNLSFAAVLREKKPTPANGHLTVRKRLTSPDLAVKGFSVAITVVDAAFVPGAEHLHVTYTVTDPGHAAVKGRIEIWGEKYPTNKPIYTKDFDNPASGTWNDCVASPCLDGSHWDGKGNAGVLNNELLTPEFTPYRVRVIVGVDQEAVENPDDVAKGRGKVAVAEAAFEVTFESIQVRLQEAVALQPAVTTALGDALNIEPWNQNGTYAASGRLPTAAPWPDETGRIRIDCLRHNQIADSLGQGHGGAPDRHRVMDPYIDGAAPSKWDIDNPVYVRPEIPVEIVPRLKSRTAGVNTAAPFGRHQPGAVGPLKLDVHVEDAFLAGQYGTLAASPPVPAPPHETYLFNAAHKVKDGRHDNPVNPVLVAYWQERIVVQHDDDRPIDLQEAYVVGANELTVYLNRTKLDLAAGDYAETSTHRITLAEKTTKQDDVVWVMRVRTAAPAVAVGDWLSYPPGDNCHHHYGGIRGDAAGGGESRSKLVRADFSGAAAVGHGTNAFPYAAKVTLDPDNAVANAERVESEVIVAAGATQGFAGFVFSPSVVGGDSYALQATAFACPYDRSLGFVVNRTKPGEGGARKPWVKGRTGTLTMWRLARITTSVKLRTPGGGLPGGVGMTDPGLGGRANPGDGLSMNIANLNALMDRAFTEWTVLPAGGDPHVAVNLGTYRAAHNGLGGAALGAVAGAFAGAGVNRPGAGIPPMPNNAAVRNDFVRWDHYREYLPPGLPANRVNLVSNVINAQPVGTSALAARDAARDEKDSWETWPSFVMPPIGAGKPDKALVGVAIPAWPLPANLYDKWVKGLLLELAGELLDQLTPGVIPPQTMCVVRWPALYQDHWSNGWNRGAHGVAGYCRGDGQSFFSTAAGNVDTFEHEMGHSLHLVHFITWSDANSCWKHHDHAYPSCKMGYSNAPNPPGGAANYTVPGSGVHGAAINLNTGARGQFCAKCLLKVRGWKEEVLPCNWPHADVF